MGSQQDRGTEKSGDQYQFYRHRRILQQRTVPGLETMAQGGDQDGGGGDAVFPWTIAQ